MPKAKRLCSRAGCRECQPCPLHPRGWASSKSPALPSNWKQIVQVVKARKICAICSSVGTEVDHIIPRAWGGSDSLDNQQLLCHDEHKQKTHEESAWGNKRRRPELEDWLDRWDGRRK